MNSPLPDSKTYVIIGAGVHGLSTAWHLAMELKQRGSGSGSDIIVLDKTGPGAGATGIACGIVRSFYMTEAMHPLLRHSVDVWNYDPVAFGFQQVGFLSCGESNQIADYERIHASQKSVGYTSDLYVGQEARDHLTKIWPDFKHHSIDVVLHERLSGYAGTRQAVNGLAMMCERHGVQILSGIEAKEFDVTNGQVSAVHTNRGSIKCDTLILATGAWMPKQWEQLGKPAKLDVTYLDGSSVKDKDMWTFWRLEEGEIYYDGPYYDSENFNPPILHIELMNTPVLDPKSG